MLTSEMLTKVRKIQIYTSKLVNELLAGRYESVFRGQGVEFKEVREYVPGDDVRNIDWNVTARTGIPHVKVLTEERELTLLIMVDASGSQRFGSVKQLKLELSAEISAVLAFSAIQNNDKVGLVVFTDEVELFLPPRKGRQYALRVIREVLYHEPRSRKTNISVALEFANKILNRKAIVFLISDFQDENFEKNFKLMARKHDLIACLIIDPREVELPNVGLVRVVDSESGEELVINTSDNYLRNEFTKFIHQELEKKKKTLLQCGADFIVIRTDGSYIDELYKFFRARERRVNR
ncbi:MAG: DUF58 domain-containing protein [Candidatus Hydrogenedentes bacterium]|nr:DUF58 domain-containing protein [Candidatus Hydrogenedentota bacterium]